MLKLRRCSFDLIFAEEEFSDILSSFPFHLLANIWSGEVFQSFRGTFHSGLLATKNYGIGAQIIKSLHIRDMILVTRSRKKVVGLEGYGIRIIKQEIIR